MEKLIVEEALPLAWLASVGLYENGQHKLSNVDISALLAGRRTTLVTLKNLKGESFSIGTLDAKLSLNQKDGEGFVTIHPVYKEPKLTPDLEQHEAWAILAKEVTNLSKDVQYPGEDMKRTMLFEYDMETREFLSYDPLKVHIPEKINGEELDEKKRKDFAIGKIVELADGVKVQFRAAEPKGIIANTTALVMTMAYTVGAGGAATFLVEAIAPLKDLSIQQSPFTASFESAYLQMEKSANIEADEKSIKLEFEDYKNEYSRGYGISPGR